MTLPNRTTGSAHNAWTPFCGGSGVGGWPIPVREIGRTWKTKGAGVLYVMISFMSPSLEMGCCVGIRENSIDEEDYQFNIRPKAIYFLVLS